MTAGWETPSRSFPKAPMNGQVVGPLAIGIYDLRWDNPTTLGANSQFTLSGVNIYRSDIGERGPYFRINPYPIGGNFYRDKTQNVLVPNETVQMTGIGSLKLSIQSLIGIMINVYLLKLPETFAL